MELIVLALAIIITGISVYLVHVNSDLFLLENKFSVLSTRISRLEDDLNSLILSSSSQLIPLRNDLKREIKLVADEVMLLKQKKEVKKINKKRKKK